LTVFFIPAIDKTTPVAVAAFFAAAFFFLSISLL